mgnify:CR=1 FL=1
MTSKSPVLDVFNKYKIFTSKGNGGAGLLSDEKQVSILSKYEAK